MSNAASGLVHLKPFLPGLEPLLEDAEVSEIMINGPGNVWIGSVPGRPVAGRGDRAGLPGFAGAAGWRPAVVAAALSSGIARRNTGGPGHNDGRSRTPRHSRPPGKSVDAGALRGSPSPPLRRDGTTRDSAWQSRSHLQMTLRRFFGPVQKNPIAG